MNHEKLLAIFYPLVVACGFICSVTTAVAWNHWKYVLDTCVQSSYTSIYEVNCGCILKGLSTITYFIGGHVGYCHWATFGLLLPIFVAIIFGCYHVWRVCFGVRRRRYAQHTVRQRSADIIVMTAKTEMTDNEVSPYWWIPASVAAIIMFIYTLVHAAMYLDGFLQSCRQYRNEIIKYVHATGPLVAAIHGRLTCSSVFDFMDYLHPDVSFDRRRIDRINTSVCLILALITAWVGVCLWLGIFIINVIQARRSRNLRV